MGSYPIDDINSTTASNEGAVDSPDNYGGATGGNEVEDSWLTMAPVDLSTYPNAIIEFETYYRSYSYEKPFIVVGIGDGAGNVTWPTDLNPDYDETTNPNVYAAFPPKRR